MGSVGIEDLLLPPPQAGPVPNLEVQVHNYCRWQSPNLSLKYTQKTVRSFSDLL